jgi:hypothetical protein
MRAASKIVLVLLAACLFADEPKLAVVQAEVHQSEDGPTMPSDATFGPGEPVYFNCRVSGFKKNDDERISLTWTLEARDSRNVLLAPPESGKIAAELSPEDRKWLPKIRVTVMLPPLADSGSYKILIRVTDEQAKSTAEAETTFRVASRAVEPSDTLVIRNFRFLRTEEDAHPLEVAAYRPGDTVWARFDMTGYKLGEKNRFDVEYGVKALRPNGQVTYDQPRAADQKDETFYPQRYAPGILSLNLPKDLARGQYTLVLSVRDNLGAQSVETRQMFSVE